MLADPSGSPASINFTDVNLTSITVHWTELSCSDRNGEITGYTLEYISPSQPTHNSNVSVSGSNNKSIVVGGLLPRTNYTFSVRALGADAVRSATRFTATSAGKLENKKTFVIEHANYGISSGLIFFLNGRILSNNSIILLGEIGEGINALYCLTNNELCCLTEAEGMHSPWNFPNGSSVAEDATAGVYFSRGFSSILLNKRSSAVGPTGVYKCLLPDASTSEPKTLRIGVYDSKTAGEL